MGKWIRPARRDRAVHVSSIPESVRGRAQRAVHGIAAEVGAIRLPKWAKAWNRRTRGLRGKEQIWPPRARSCGVCRMQFGDKAECNSALRRAMIEDDDEDEQFIWGPARFRWFGPV